MTAPEVMGQVNRGTWEKWGHPGCETDEGKVEWETACGEPGVATRHGGLLFCNGSDVVRTAFLDKEPEGPEAPSV